jgi:zinc transport system permease protein
VVDHVPTWAELAAGWELFRDPILCAILAGFVLGFLGVFVVLRRMVFVTATVSQSAGLGVAFAFFFEIHLGIGVHPVLFAMFLSLLSTSVFALHPERIKLSRESVLGLTYIATGAGSILIGDRIAQEAHDISAILFGTAVLVRPIDLYLVAIMGAVVTIAMAFLYRGIVFAGFDPAAARVHRLSVRAIDLLLWFLVAIEVSVATRALGVLPVFAFAVLPAMSALAFGVGLGASLVLAALFGAVSGGLGYLLAFFASFPVGASQALTAALLFLLVLPYRLLRSRR